MAYDGHRVGAGRGGWGAHRALCARCGRAAAMRARAGAAAMRARAGAAARRARAGAAARCARGC